MKLYIQREWKKTKQQGEEKIVCDGAMYTICSCKLNEQLVHRDLEVRDEDCHKSSRFSKF